MIQEKNLQLGNDPAPRIIQAPGGVPLSNASTFDQKLIIKKNIYKNKKTFFSRFFLIRCITIPVDKFSTHDFIKFFSTSQ